MLRNKLSVPFVATLFFLLISLTFKSAFAQEMRVLYGVFPQQGSLGAEVNLLLSGEGFESLGELTSTLISGQEIPVLDYEPISNNMIRVLIRIPEQATVRETEISFIFGELRLDAYFVVTERGGQEVSPAIRQINPQDGQVDTEMALFFVGARLFELGELGGVIIGGTDIPVIDYNIESERSTVIAIYLPPETPLGETEISVFFENYSFEDFFLVRGPEPIEPEPPRLPRLDPQEGFVDTEMELTLEGEGFFELGDLIGVTIGGIDLAILNRSTESNNFMVVAVYLPPELPTGETGIVFFFENTSFEEFFFVHGREPGGDEPGFPRLIGLNPQGGEVDSEIELFLEGVNFFELGELVRVSIGNFEIPVQNYDIESNESMVVSVYLPEETPRGGQIMAFFFENTGFEESFFVDAPSPRDFPTTTVVVVIVVVVGVGGIVGRRLIRRRKPAKEEPREKPDQPPPKIELFVSVDPGTQSVERAEPSLKMDIDLRFEIEMDNGEQSVEVDGDTIIGSE